MSVTPSLVTIHQLCWLSFMAAGLAATALFPLFIGAVPITFQDCMVICCGVILGPRQGAKAVLLYILAGCLGLPIFSGARGGLAHLLGPTGGYLAGFVFLALFSGLSTQFYHKKQTLNGTICVLLYVAGYAILFTIGSFWLAFTMRLSIYTALMVGTVPFLPITALKLIVLLPTLFYLYPRLTHLTPHAKTY